MFNRFCSSCNSGFLLFACLSFTLSGSLLIEPFLLYPSLFLLRLLFLFFLFSLLPHKRLFGKLLGHAKCIWRLFFLLFFLIILNESIRIKDVELVFLELFQTNVCQAVELTIVVFHMVTKDERGNSRRIPAGHIFLGLPLFHFVSEDVHLLALASDHNRNCRRVALTEFELALMFDEDFEAILNAEKRI